jgi:taurine dioxygenase
MRYEPLGATGVEVHDLNLSKGVSTKEQAMLRSLLDDYQLLLFRGQDLSDKDHVRVMQYFGSVLDETFDGTRVSFVSNNREGAFVPEGRLLFHSDLAFCPEPLQANSLYAIKIPPGGTSTWFANAERAAACLGVDLAERVEGREALHLQDLRSQRSDRRFRDGEVPAEQPRTTHPVLWSHPRTGKPVLYVNELQTDSILGLTVLESEELLGELLAILYDSANVLEHSWQEGDLVIWDNVSLQHGRGEMPEHEERTHRRVVLGERGVVEQVPSFVPLV